MRLLLAALVALIPALVSAQSDTRRFAPAPPTVDLPDRPEMDAGDDARWDLFSAWLDARNAGDKVLMADLSEQMGAAYDAEEERIVLTYGPHSREAALFWSSSIYKAWVAHGPRFALTMGAEAARIERAFNARTELFRTFSLDGATRGAEGRSTHAAVMLMTYAIGRARNEADRDLSLEAMAIAFEAAQLLLIGDASQAAARHSAQAPDPVLTMMNHYSIWDPAVRPGAGEATRLHGLRREIMAAMRMRQWLAGQQDPDALLTAELSAAQADLRRRVAAETLSGHDLAALLFPQPVSLFELHGTLDPGEAIMLLVRDAVRYTLILVLPDAGVFPARTNLADEDIRAVASRLRGAMSTSDYRAAAPLVPPTAPSGQALDDAHLLYSELFAWAEPLLQDTDRIHVVATDALSAIPAEMLLTRPAEVGEDYADMGWLVRRHAFQVVPSLDGFLRRAPKDAAAPAYVGLSDPVYDSVAASDVVFGMAPLPETRAEVARLAAFFPDPQVHTGAAATEANLLAAAPVLRAGGVLHIATHGVGQGEMAWHNPAFLALSPGTLFDTPRPFDLDYWSGVDPDGVLFSHEIAQIEMAPDLVILSACNSVVDPDPLIGYGGLAAAFLSGGTRRVMGSHWPVNSQAAVELVTAMARHDPSFTDPMRALRAAMLETIDKGGHRAHPSYWAPFSIIGAP